MKQRLMKDYCTKQTIWKEQKTQVKHNYNRNLYGNL